jgi:hypothetical protein
MTKQTDDQHKHDAEVELEQAFRVAAIYVNRFWIRIGRTTTRITFGEAAAEMTPNFRVAVVMPSVEALRLAATLHSLADKLQEQVAATEHPPSAVEPLN